MNAISHLPGFVGALAVAEARATIGLHPDQEMIPYPGSAVRGALGMRLLRGVCRVPGRVCRGCPEAGVCLFPSLFAPEGGERGPRTPPAAWSLDVRRDWPDGDVSVCIRTYGTAAVPRLDALCGALNEAVEAREVAGVPALWIRWQRAAQATSVRLDDRLGPIEPARHVRVHFESPLDLKVDNRPSAEPPTLAQLAGAIRRRAVLLASAWGGSSEAPVRQPPLSIAPLAPTRCKVRGVSIRRWSEHQGRAMHLHGIVGWLDYEPVDVEAMTWLRVAEVLGVGRHTTMGFGGVGVGVACPKRVDMRERPAQHSGNQMEDGGS